MHLFSAAFCQHKKRKNPENLHNFHLTAEKGRGKGELDGYGGIALPNEKNRETKKKESSQTRLWGCMNGPSQQRQEKEGGEAE